MLLYFSALLFFLVGCSLGLSYLNLIGAYSNMLGVFSVCQIRIWLDLVFEFEFFGGVLCFSHKGNFVNVSIFCHLSSQINSILDGNLFGWPHMFCTKLTNCYFIFKRSVKINTFFTFILTSTFFVSSNRNKHDFTLLKQLARVKF